MLRGSQVLLRPGRPEDVDALVSMFAAPEVAEWWVGFDRARVESEVLHDDDPAAANGRAVSAYAKVGFRPVGILRQNERGADGTFHDTLLMDVVRGELR